MHRSPKISPYIDSLLIFAHVVHNCILRVFIIDLYSIVFVCTVFFIIAKSLLHDKTLLTHTHTVSLISMTV